MKYTKNKISAIKGSNDNRTPPKSILFKIVHEIQTKIIEQSDNARSQDHGIFLFRNLTM